jgi:hypothetical protein
MYDSCRSYRKKLEKERSRQIFECRSIYVFVKLKRMIIKGEGKKRNSFVYKIRGKNRRSTRGKKNSEEINKILAENI